MPVVVVPAAGDHRDCRSGKREQPRQPVVGRSAARPEGPVVLATDFGAVSLAAERVAIGMASEAKVPLGEMGIADAAVCQTT